MNMSLKSLHSVLTVRIESFATERTSRVNAARRPRCPPVRRCRTTTARNVRTDPSTKDHFYFQSVIPRQFYFKTMM